MESQGPSVGALGADTEAVSFENGVGAIGVGAAGTTRPEGAGRAREEVAPQEAASFSLA